MQLLIGEGCEQAAVRYRRFALFSTPSAAIGAITGQLTILLIPFFFATDVAENALGFYGMALAAIGIPISYVARSVAHPFFVSAAEAQLAGNLSRITSVVHRRLIMIGLFPVLAVMVAGPDFFELWLGTSFRQGKDRSMPCMLSLPGWSLAQLYPRLHASMMLPNNNALTL